MTVENEYEINIIYSNEKEEQEAKRIIDDLEKDSKSTFTGGTEMLSFCEKTINKQLDKINLGEKDELSNAQREYSYYNFWFTSGVYKYQENPVLLDPIMPRLTNHIFDKMQQVGLALVFKGLCSNFFRPLPTLLKAQISQDGRFHNGGGYIQICRFLYKLMNIRGRKKLDKYFPHEVAHLRIILRHLEALEFEEIEICAFASKQNFTRQNSPEFLLDGNYEAKTVLMGWLSALMRIPFSFEKIDPTFREKVVGYCQKFMFQGGILQGAVFITRERSRYK